MEKAVLRLQYFPAAVFRQAGDFRQRRRRGGLLLGELLALLALYAALCAFWLPTYVGHAKIETGPKALSALTTEAYSPPPATWVGRNHATGWVRRYYRPDILRARRARRVRVASSSLPAQLLLPR